jgi:hypothetical protein
MKRIKLFLKKLVAKKTVILNVSNKNSLHIIEVEKDCNSLIESLGMSEEKADELYKECKILFLNYNNVVEIASIISKKCVHANELYFCCVAITSIHNEMTNPMNFLQQMFNKK